MLNDRKERDEATDINHSYIVQAPAGSGKTEILTQRFLKLLSIVQAPEQIVALTFTRKAANEMRERVLSALQQASQGIIPTSAHQQQTLEYATLALKRSKRLNWRLLEQPSRLRMMTIDALCQTITQAIPLPDKQLAYAELCEKPQVLYDKAAQLCFHESAHHPEHVAHIKTLLYHLDNRQDLLLPLFSDLLAKRDQWLPLLYQARLQDKAAFETAIAWIEQHELERFKKSIPKVLVERLITLIQQFALIQRSLSTFAEISADTLEAFNAALASQLADLLLTSQQSLRKRLDHHVGLKRGSCPDEIYDELKQESQELFEALAALPDFVESLIRVRQLPSPLYQSKQWDVLQALFNLLPLLVAHLQILLMEENKVDFIAIAEQARFALGDQDNPTDLTLYLDNQIHHLLIDEFQDTSIQQYQLLSQLIQGWELNDGRTLFVVGDPMQSIYRFRSAEVGLFLRAQSKGIGPVKLIPLTLTCNFRSTATMVNWVNQQFQFIFPKTNDIESGAVTFHASVAIEPALEQDALDHQQPHFTQSHINAYHFENKQDEAIGLVETVLSELQQYPNDTVAILVRSRHQLPLIVQLLREKNIPFQGVEIDLLANLPHLRDVWSLVQALLMPANRLAFLSVLRSPWCGLSLTDLHAIAANKTSKSIYETLSQLDKITNLSAQGRIRATYFYTILQQAFMSRHQQPLVDWLIQTLEALHLTALLTPSQQDDLEQFWILLERFEEDGFISDLERFQKEFNRLYSQNVTPARLQIMTIHKSKGLEFDTVILPGLSAPSKNRDTPLLRWLRLPTDSDGELLLCSPMKAADEEHCLLYDYLGKIDTEKNSYELQRLLYVAVTRAKKRLYLFDNQLTSRQGTCRHLLEQQVFTTQEEVRHPKCPSPFGENIGKDVRHPEHSEGSPESRNDGLHWEELPPNAPVTTLSDLALPNLYHLPIDFYHTDQTPKIQTNRVVSSKMGLPNSLPRLIGIIAHELLQWICTTHPQHLTEVPWHLAEQQLIQVGLTQDACQKAMQQLKTQISQLFTDPIGQWLIQAHSAEQNEFELLKQEESTWVTRIIDRTFYHQDIRWIIDFKTGQDDPETENKHRIQVNEYAALLAADTHCPIHCGLYYLTNSHWVTWAWNKQKTNAEPSLIL